MEFKRIKSSLSNVINENRLSLRLAVIRNNIEMVEIIPLSVPESKEVIIHTVDGSRSHNSNTRSDFS